MVEGLQRTGHALDHVHEFVLLAWCVFFGFVLGRMLVQVLQPKPSHAVLLSAEEIERNRAEAEERWRNEQAEQRRLLAVEIAERLRPEVDVAEDDMLRIQNARG